MASTGRPSVLLVEVPAAEELVGRHRLQWDPVTAQGIPAHVTALFPFVDGGDVDEALLDRIAGVAARQPAFDFRLSCTAWFDDEVLYLAPEDPTPFNRLIRALVAEFPDHPPYGGAYDEDHPHLTVARRSASSGSVEEIEADLSRGLPISGHAAEMTLMTEAANGRWTMLRRFPLGG